jgi:hypothetical protein
MHRVHQDGDWQPGQTLLHVALLDQHRQIVGVAQFGLVLKGHGFTGCGKRLKESLSLG